MSKFAALAIGVCLWALNSLALAAQPVAVPASLVITPSEFSIVGNDDAQQILVSGSLVGRTDITGDFTGQAKYESSDPKVASVSEQGLVTPRGNGSTIVRATIGKLTASAKVTIADFGLESRISFRNQVIPLFTKTGCNSGGCHGKASGQNGFKLSLLGFDPDYDHAAIVKFGRGRRVFPAAPERSLLLEKATATVPHGGGQRIAYGSPEHELLLRWIEQGLPAGSSADPYVSRIECQPQNCVVAPGSDHQVIVTAYYSDGRQRDVTRESQFKCNETSVANVDDSGLVTTEEASGETAVMARFMGQVDVCRLTLPMTNSSTAPAWPKLAANNFVDEAVQVKWRQLKLVPSPLADDNTFVRRAFIDAIGTFPTADEVRKFQDDTDPQKRSKLIDQVLARNEYADFWATKWDDLFRNRSNRQKQLQRGTFAFHAWLRNAMAMNMPYDKFVRNILAAQGTIDQHPPINWYRQAINRETQTNDSAQIFLGTRINCAQCHHHPFEKWSQDDYYQYQAFFARVSLKNYTGGDIGIFVNPTGQVNHPSTRQVMTPHGLGGPEVTIEEDEDPRHRLVDWMVSPENPFFARAITNRIWAHFMGRGLVEPLDDMRVTNPPSNPALLDSLAKDFIEYKFDLKQLMRNIMNSTAYQLSAEPTPSNIQDQQNYARAYPRRIIAEVILDGVNQITETQEAFGGLPKGTRAIQLPDDSTDSYFLEIFGRPKRESACECERPREANLAQTLHLINSSDIQNKIGAASGRIARLMKAKKSDEEIVADLYLATYARALRPDEKETVLHYVKSQPDKKAAFEDLLWAMLNTKEFLFNR